MRAQEQKQPAKDINQESLSDLTIGMQTSIAEILGLDPNKTNTQKLIDETLKISDTLMQIEEIDTFNSLEESRELILKKEAIAKLLKDNLKN